MQTLRLKFFAFIVLLVVAAGVQAVQPAKVNDVLFGAMSPFEDMIEQALDKRDVELAKTLAVADQKAPDVKAVLGAAAASQFTDLMASLHQAASAKDHHKLAGSSVAIFRLLIDNLHSKGLKEPREVSLLDYAGFNLRVLAAAPNPRWQDVRKTVGDAMGWWKAIESKVSKKNLQNAFGNSIRGLEDAARLENLPLLRFAAQIELDLVDLLEGDFRSRR